MSVTTENIMDTRSDIDIQISDMNTSLDTSYNFRKAIIEKMVPSLHKMPELDLNLIEAEHLDSISNFISTANKLLDAQDKNRVTKVQVQLKKKDSETSEKLGAMVAETLRQLPISDLQSRLSNNKVEPGTIVVPENEDEELFSKIGTQLETEGVIILDTEKRDDYLDIGQKENDV